MNDAIDRLHALFERFPGIGPRQAGRFVQFLLRSSPSLRKELAESVTALSGSVKQCVSCFRYFAGQAGECSLCSSPSRDSQFLVVVAHDADLLALERSGTYKGYYFVIGGTISLVSEKPVGLHMRELHAIVKKRAANGLLELIIAFPANPEGDATAIKVREELAEDSVTYAFKTTELGRGLSTGSELEYADQETLQSAFKNRR